MSSPTVPGAHFDVVLVDHATLDAGARLSAGSKQRWIGLRTDRRRQLGHVERRVHVDAEALCDCERILVPGHGDHRAQRMIAIATARRLIEQEARHRTDEAAAGDVEATHRVPERLRLEAVVEHARAALGEPIHHCADAADMEQRQVREQPVILAEVVHRHRAADPRLDVRAHDRLRRTGRARSEDDVVRIPRLHRLLCFR